MRHTATFCNNIAQNQNPTREITGQPHHPYIAGMLRQKPTLRLPGRLSKLRISNDHQRQCVIVLVSHDTPFSHSHTSCLIKTRPSSIVSTQSHIVRWQNGDDGSHKHVQLHTHFRVLIRVGWFWTLYALIQCNWYR